MRDQLIEHLHAMMSDIMAIKAGQNDNFILKRNIARFTAQLFSQEWRNPGGGAGVVLGWCIVIVIFNCKVIKLLSFYKL